MDNNVTTPDIMDALIPQAQRRETINIPDTRERRIAFANKLHTERTELEGQIQQAERRQWMTGVVIGYTLAQIKQDCAHGEWLRLFKGGRGKANSQRVVNFNFSDNLARVYIDLYKGVAKKCRKLGGDKENEMTRMLQEPGEQLYLALGEMSDATSIRAARADLCDDDKPRYDAERRTANLLAHRNTDGRPSKEEVVDTQAALDLQRRLNEEELQRIARDLHLFIHNGRHAIIGEEANRSAADVLRAALDALSAMRYS